MANNITSMIEFPIGEIRGDAPMKSIPLKSLPNFHGLSFEDMETFLFEFDVIRRGYDYVWDAQKLNIFHDTLKGTLLRWFMGLGGKSITTWDNMKKILLEQYQDYCKSRDIKEEIFKIMQKEDENMEDFVAHFKYSLQRSGHSDLEKGTLKIFLLWALREESLELFNVVGNGDILKQELDTICELCVKCSRGAVSHRQGTQALKTPSSGVKKVEIGNLLYNLRTDILNTLSSQLDVLQEK